MTIKTLMGVVIVAVVTGSALAAVELVDAPTPCRLVPFAPTATAPAASSDAVIFVMSERAGQGSIGGDRPGRRQPRVVLLTPRPSPATR